MPRVHHLLFLAFTCCLSSCIPAQEQAIEWPPVSHETKPWTRWWWHGSAVTKAGITSELESFKKAGLGGVEITPIFGVAGEETHFIEYLSPRWMDMLIHTLKEAERLELGVDMATGTGWPFGGPWVSAKHAPKNIRYRAYKLGPGDTLKEPVACIQEPLVRTVKRSVTIDQLAYPIAANQDLQDLAPDQVRYKKNLPLVCLMAYSANGGAQELTDLVDEKGRLHWKAPAGEWTLYALFRGWHGKMVERAAPGGEGNVIDHFSDEALSSYLAKFDTAFEGRDIASLRAFFNDSYEVDDAQGQADWTPALFAEFKKRRGYDLKDYLPALFAESQGDIHKRVLCDFRETMGELISEKFTRGWDSWAQDKGAATRNQAHGSPANILDLYAAADIPETEGNELLKIKFASSAANVSGKKLSSAESATWLNEHFLSSLSDIKTNLEHYLLGGINHVFYHGTAYSPDEAEWPGWLFYAAIHANDRNTWWEDFPALNRYITRVQSFMQSGKPDNDILLYFPIYDRYSEPGHGLLMHFDIRGSSFDSSEVKKTGEYLLQLGYTFDFISDRQLGSLTVLDSRLLSGNVSYEAVLIPYTHYMPLETLTQLARLARSGARVLFHRALPEEVPGLGNLAARQRQLDSIKQIIRPASLTGNELGSLLAKARIRRERLADRGLQFNRRRHSSGYYYFVVNHEPGKTIEGFVPLNVTAKSALVFNPMDGTKGAAAIKTGAESTEVYLQLQPGESCIIATYDQHIREEPYPYRTKAGAPVPIRGEWEVTFIKGGPVLPETQSIGELMSWTTFAGKHGEAFSGTAAYTIHFPRPAQEAKGWILDLGKVHESARVTLNGKTLATLLGPSYRVHIDAALLRAHNSLKIEVSNLMANRIAYMDRNHIRWKKFYNVNFPAKKKENMKDGLFNAAHWKPLTSGLLGPVTLTPSVPLSFQTSVR